MPDLPVVVVGAGLAGLACARALTDEGIATLLIERADAPGGTTRLSSGWIWRYRDHATLRAHAPGGDAALGGVIVDELDDACAALARWAGDPAQHGTANPLTHGARWEAEQLVEQLVAGLPNGVLRCGMQVARFDVVNGRGMRVHLARGPAAASEPASISCGAIVLCGGGHAADVQRLGSDLGAGSGATARWLARHAGLSDGSAQRAACEQGADLAGPAGIYGRAMPDGVAIGPDQLVSRSLVLGDAAQLVLVDAATGEESVATREAHDWSDAVRTLALARHDGPAHLVVDASQLDRATPYGSVGDVLARLLAEGAIESARTIPVRAGITHTTAGLRCDARARVLDASGVPVAGGRLLAAGVEVGGIAGRGYVGGLGQALVQGLVAARSAAAVTRAR